MKNSIFLLILLNGPFLVSAQDVSSRLSAFQVNLTASKSMHSWNEKNPNLNYQFGNDQGYGVELNYFRNVNKRLSWKTGVLFNHHILPVNFNYQIPPFQFQNLGIHAMLTGKIKYGRSRFLFQPGFILRKTIIGTHVHKQFPQQTPSHFPGDETLMEYTLELNNRNAVDVAAAFSVEWLFLVNDNSFFSLGITSSYSLNRNYYLSTTRKTYIGASDSIATSTENADAFRSIPVQVSIGFAKTINR